MDEKVPRQALAQRFDFVIDGTFARRAPPCFGLAKRLGDGFIQLRPDGSGHRQSRPCQADTPPRRQLENQPSDGGRQASWSKSKTLRMALRAGKLGGMMLAAKLYAASSASPSLSRSSQWRYGSDVGATWPVVAG
jgi:hypothetical protein